MSKTQNNFNRANESELIPAEVEFKPAETSEKQLLIQDTYTNKQISKEMREKLTKRARMFAAQGFRNLVKGKKEVSCQIMLEDLPRISQRVYNLH